MESIYLFFQANIKLVYFIYGLVFFMMGFAIALQNEKKSSLILSRSFNYLAIFGIVHGISEWGHVFIPIAERYSSDAAIAAMHLIEANLIGFSFVFLLYFGVKLCVDTLDLPEQILWIPKIAGFLWFTGLIVYPHLMQLPDINQWYLLADIVSRYAFAFPGSALAAYGIWLQRDDLASLGQPSVFGHLRWTAVMFALYAVFAGLIVPQAPFFPANRLNIQNLFSLTGFPVAVYRATIVAVISYFVIRLTAIFNYEYRQELIETQQSYAILRERQRIRRDMHDGILQGIYAVGLSMDTAKHLTTVNPAKAADIIAKGNQRLDEINTEIRHYIMDMQSTTFGELSVKEIVLGMVEEFKDQHKLPVEVRIHDSRNEKLSSQHKEQIYFIVQELLTNIARHSKATKAAVSLVFHPQHLILEVSDNGIGLPAKQRRSGLQNIMDRSEQIGADIEIQSSKQNGTLTRLQIPYN
ncbi:sensor histidine kinase [Dethiobacter alkaliphilus]|uniref:histidine kinase n=1 Tax=Dethiobacter alkaliphilus AHT 1 TaxID=555088 RepID=C0GFA2_DETAL|nr:histidine kinase [Dethiobacter alkaliphilus]EEG77862.1 integral membrane sensor signal transduction histidine kinase [Dethiobacter alkaliphilus AHT 1]